MKDKRKILIFSDWYEPGFKAGGPIRSCVNFSDNMASDYDVFVFTTDRDHGDQQPYANISTNVWTTIKSINIYYASPAQLSWTTISRVFKEINPDFVYLNSMFSRYMSIYPLLIKRMGHTNAKMILAPRGMLKQTALQFKRRKKTVFLGLFKMLGLHQNIIFHATDDTEQKDVQATFGKNSSCIQISNFPPGQKTHIHRIQKHQGEIRIIFVGRVHPIKNLLLLLNFVNPLQANVLLTIVGAVEDEIYWNKCLQVIESFPQHIQTQFKENVPNNLIGELIEDHHIFALPTEGENFGHAIFESLSVGRPVLISDQTPWRNLPDSKAGWDLHLKNAEAFTAVLQQVSEMNNGEFQEWCKGAWNLAHDYITNSDLKNQYLKLFS